VARLNNRATSPIHTHSEVPYSPRAVLKSQVARLKTMAVKAFIATEPEHFLFNGSYEEAQQGGYSDLLTFSAYNEDYHIL
jgi:glutamine synthetase